MLEFFALFVLGVFLLVKSSDLFVVSASRLAKIFGVSELVIGLTVVAIGTSLPEFAASVMASLAGNPEIATGNVIGSNIANLALILGVSAIFHNLKIEKSLFQRECYILLGVTFLFYIMALDKTISFADGLVLIFLFFLYLFFMFKFKVQFHEVFKVRLYIEHLLSFRKFLRMFEQNFKKIFVSEAMVLLISLLGLYFGAEFMVNSASNIAKLFSLSDTFIGATLVSLGTSLPELAVALVSLKKGFHNMLIGNIVGSNIINILFVGGFAALVNSLPVLDFTLFVLGPFLIIVSAIFLLFAWSDLTIKRPEGIVLFLLYILFLIMILPHGA
ncbi:calcium/sodium antiporter [Candidatus Micrarchaeota archaeon]|nr:calcium/sodium antiporter [Candidatus Micrarchaeota archaeon]MBU2476043.1 calcium/sodium antiporter [Candidatus Micrarchaeota archaeon]